VRAFDPLFLRIFFRLGVNTATRIFNSLKDIATVLK
jgi:hypothetical protein